MNDPRLNRFASKVGMTDTLNKNQLEQKTVLDTAAEKNWRNSLKVGDDVYLSCALYGYCVKKVVSRVGRLNVELVGDKYSKYRIQTGRRSSGNTAMIITSTPFQVSGLSQVIAAAYPTNEVPDLRPYV